MREERANAISSNGRVNGVSGLRKNLKIKNMDENYKFTLELEDDFDVIDLISVLETTKGLEYLGKQIEEQFNATRF